VFDPFSLTQDFCSACEVDIGRCKTVQAFVVTAVIIVVDEVADFGLKLAIRTALTADTKRCRMVTTAGRTIRIAIIVTITGLWSSLTGVCAAPF
jgi:hypothetical protein